MERRFWPYIGAVIGFVVGILLLVNWRVVVVFALTGIGYLVAKWVMEKG